MVFERALQQRIVRMMRLYQHRARLAAPPCPASDLNNSLGKALGRPKIGRKQAAVGVHHTDQGHFWKVMPFCQHLRAQQNVDLTRPHRAIGSL